MKKKLRSSLSLLLSFMMVVSVFATVPFSVSAASTGSWGDLTWNIDDNGKLTFSGSGSIPNSGFKNNQTIKEVEINSSVTSMGHWVFQQCDALEKVTFTSNPSIGMQIFCWNNNLKSVTFAEGMTTLPSYTFTRVGYNKADSEAELVIKLPSTLTTIRDSAFANSRIKKVNIPDGVDLPQNTLEGAVILNLIFEGGPRVFKPGQYSNFTNLTTVTIAEGTRVFGDTSKIIVSNNVDEMEREFYEDYLLIVNEDYQDYLSQGLDKDVAFQRALGSVPMNPSGYELDPGENYDLELTAENAGIVFGNAVVNVLPNYTVTWKDADGTELEKDENVAQGETPSYTGEAPNKADGVCCNFTFAGWNDGIRTYSPDALPAVNGDVTYTAVFTDSPKDGYYKTTVDGHSVYSIVPLGDDIAGGETSPYFYVDNDTEYFRLTSLNNCKYYYYDENGTDILAGFTKSKSGDYYVVVTDAPMPKIVLVKPVYTIRWNNWDDTPISILGTDVIYGERPEYDGETPTKPEDENNTYTFAGWNDGTTTYAPDALPEATDNVTYKATFNSTPKTHTHDGITFEPWTSTDSLPTTAGNYYLTGDVALSSTWTVPGGTTNLCLNGHGIIRTGTGRVIDLSSSGRNLNIYDCDNVTEHKFTVSNPTENGAGLAVVNDDLTEDYQTFTGGYITGGKSNSGAGIHVNQATLRLYGGTVIGNSNTGDGGGIYVERGGNLYIAGGSVSYNQARQGGGIYAPNISSYAKIYLNSGKIEKNYATYTGGGVYGGMSVPVYLQGSIVVTGNYSLNAAGITAAWNNSAARIYVSGSPYVYDNFNANGQSNLHGAYYENTMQITGSLGADCKVGLNAANGLLNYYKSDYTHTELDPNVLFPYDNNNYILVKDGNNAKRIQLYTITFKNYDDEELQSSKVISGTTPKYNGATPTKPDDENNTYTFAGWNDGTTTYAPDALPEATGNVTYTATFTSTPFVASVTSNGTTTKYTDFAQAVNAWAPASAPAGSTLTLLANINYNPGISVAGTKTLDLNGHGINGTGTIVFNGDGILTDSNPDTVHYFDVQNGLAVNVNDVSGEKSFTGGYLTGGTGDWGSALQVNGALTMNGGTVIGNTSNYSGAVRVHNNKTLTMTGGQIIYNRCAAQRGGNDASLNAESNAIIKISGNPVIKNNVNPAGKPANVIVRITFTNKLNVIGDLTDGAEIGITMQTNAGADYTGAFTASTDTSNNDASKFFSDNSSYTVGKNADGQLVLGVPRTVTCLNDDGTTIDTTTVADGAVPTHEAPTKLGNNFAGWKNGETTYAPNEALPEVTGDVTYTATFTPKKLISNCNLTLDGDIIINFNIDPSAAGLTTENIGDGKQLKVNFEWTKDFGNAEDKPKTVISKYNKTITVDSSNVGSKITVSCPVCAAEMSCQVRATATLNGVTDTRDYSVRDYADSVLAPREGSNFEKMKNENPTQYNKLASLVTAMVDYGAKAQQVFNINIDDPANKNLAEQNGYEMDEEVTDDMFVTAVKSANKGAEASNMKKVAEKLGANYYTSSLIFLDRSTLRHYFTKKDSTFNPSLFGNNHQNNTYYYVEETNIPAHELDKLQEFKIGNNTTFYYSALDYARGLNASSAATPEMKDLAKSLYWYSQAANGYIS